MLHFNLSIHHVMLGETAQALESFAETLHVTKTLNNPLAFDRCACADWRDPTDTRRIGIGGARLSAGDSIHARNSRRADLFAWRCLSSVIPILLREQNRFDEAIRHAEQGIAFAQVWLPSRQHGWSDRACPHLKPRKTAGTKPLPVSNKPFELPKPAPRS